MTDAQAAVGLVQLKKLDSNNKKRKWNATYLVERLKGVKGILLPKEDPNGIHTWHLFLIRLTDDFKMSKKDFMWELYTKKGIKAWSHYMPIHLTKPYVAQGHRQGECPVAEEAFKRYVTFPLHPSLTVEALDYLADSIISLSEL
jgi:dTDP-4-amino-4,6-dideoxygalactose transaminase